MSDIERKSDFQNFLEQAILLVCLAVLALRTTYADTINSGSFFIWSNLNSDIISLAFSGILLICIILWFGQFLFTKNLQYRLSMLEIPILIFTASGIMGIFIASNKRAAVNEFANLIIPLLLMLVLVQVLDDRKKIYIVLAVVVAIGVASAYRCGYQYFVDTQMMIDQYESDPQSLLTPSGINPGSFEAFLFEHRLYSKGINGFLITSNSVASFSILATFSAIAIILSQLRNLKKHKDAAIYITLSIISLLAVLMNFLFVRSKGGTIGLLAALIFLGLLCFWGDFIKKHRGKLLIAITIMICGILFIAINYGQENGRLPGGNSMLVRWQYWKSAVEMSGDHPYTGVGPGNFAIHFPRYKDPAAIEVVKDPHNFVLALLSQYGAAGLTAFLTLLFLPIWRVLHSKSHREEIPDDQKDISKIPVGVILFIVAVLLFLRPFLEPVKLVGEQALTIFYVVVVLFIAPAALFLLGFFLAWPRIQCSSSKSTNYISIALLCGCVGLIVHNLIDFAIFEPGIYTLLWITIACLIASLHQQSNKKPFNIRLHISIKLLILLLLVIPGWAFYNYAFIPVYRVTNSLTTAYNNITKGFWDQGQIDIKSAIEHDRFDPSTALTSGKMYLDNIEYYGPKQYEMLLIAKKNILESVKRNPEDFKAYEKLTEAYKQLAERSSGSTRKKWLNEALSSARRAVEYYPGSARLHINLAETAEKLNKNDIELRSYQKAVEIEDAYRKQFKIMYPDMELFSRLGCDKYKAAKERIDVLSK